jgi:CzcA family heavy metal efflux pump
MISRIIEWCEQNRFLVFTAAVLLTVAGVWSLRHVPLDALPDISDVQVVIHTEWAGEPPNVIEDQVTYPIVTALLAAPHVKSVRAQTMFGDSYVFVVFEDGTDLYWARSRVTEYLQQIGGRLPADVHPAIGPDATGAGWVYEYAVIDRTHTKSLADLRALQDWYLRYQLETVPGVAEVATIGGYVRQYQVKLDPNKLFSYGIPVSTVIDRVRDSTNEVGGNVLEMNGAEYMVRGLGYLRSVADLENVPVATKNGTPVLLRDLGSVDFGPEVRRGAADWQGEGETVGGIVVMRFGMNALNVISGVKAKLREIAPSLPPGVEIVTGYDRSWLINESIKTLKRDLIAEAIIVSFVSIAFLFHLRSALVPIITLPIAVLAAFIPMYWLNVSSNVMSLGGLALAIGVLVDAAIVMVENGYKHLAERSGLAAGEHTENLSSEELFADHHPRVVPSRFSFGGAGRAHVPPTGLDQDVGVGLFLAPFDHAGPRAHAVVHPRPVASGIAEPHGTSYASYLFARLALVFAALEIADRDQPDLSGRDRSVVLQTRQPIHARPIRGIRALHAIGLAGHFHSAGNVADAGAGPDHPFLSGGGKRVRHGGPFRQRHRQCAARHVRHHHYVEAPGEMATRSHV